MYFFIRYGKGEWTKPDCSETATNRRSAAKIFFNYHINAQVVNFHEQNEILGREQVVTSLFWRFSFWEIGAVICGRVRLLVEVEQPSLSMHEMSTWVPAVSSPILRFQ